MYIYTQTHKHTHIPTLDDRCLNVFWISFPSASTSSVVMYAVVGMPSTPGRTSMITYTGSEQKRLFGGGTPCAQRRTCISVRGGRNVTEVQFAVQNCDFFFLRSGERKHRGVILGGTSVARFLHFFSCSRFQFKKQFYPHVIL